MCLTSQHSPTLVDTIFVKRPHESGAIQVEFLDFFNFENISGNLDEFMKVVSLQYLDRNLLKNV